MMLGAISAVSLPLGSIAGLKIQLRPQSVAAMAAFGAGALIAALSVELVAPTLFELEWHGSDHGPGDPLFSFYALIIGAVLGGILFVLLNHAVNSGGGFLRRPSTTISYFTNLARRRDMQRLEELSSFPLVKDLDSEHVNTLLSVLRPERFRADECLAREGDPGDMLLFVVSGAIDARSQSGLSATFEAGSVVGLIPMFTDLPQPGTLCARGEVIGYSLSRDHATRLRSLSPEFDSAIRTQTAERLNELVALFAARDVQSMRWLKDAGRALVTGTALPDSPQLRMAKAEHPGAPMAIWLGMLLDGIPESVVIGFGLLVMLESAGSGMVIEFAQVVPYTLIAGLFLSNFPEAFASSSNMLRQGWSSRRILLLWSALVIVTATGAGAGFLVANDLAQPWLVFAKGLAAGSMLTMIAAAMIPEAVHMGNASTVGLSTLGGFLAAVSFKLLEL